MEDFGGLAIEQSDADDDNDDNGMVFPHLFFGNYNIMSYV